MYICKVQNIVLCQNLKLSFVGSFEVPSQTYNYTCTQDYVKVSTVEQMNIFLKMYF